jgi:hypothetical protein
MVISEIDKFLSESVAAGILTSDQKDLWLQIFERLENRLSSEEYNSLVEEARVEFVDHISHRENMEPTPEAFKKMLEKTSVEFSITPGMADGLKPFIAAGVVDIASDTEKIKIKAASLLPKIILRVGYSLPEEVQEWGRPFLTRSQAAWQGLGKSTRNLIDKAIYYCNSIDAQLKPIGAPQGWGPNELYDSGSIIYKNSSQAVFIFSRTSGLVVPAEYDPRKYSVDKHPKHPARSKYFDELLNEQTELLRFYQWNRYSTAKRLYESCQSVGKILTKSGSIEILARALQMPNFEITEADFGFGDETIAKTKAELTLTFRTGVVISERKDEFKAITHTLYNLSPINDKFIQFTDRFLPSIEPNLDRRWDDNFLTASTSQYTIPSVLYHRVYKYGITNTIKNWNDPPVTETRAHQIAGDIFERLYSEGENIVEKKLTEDEFLRRRN